MKPFSKSELHITLFILLLIGVVTIQNLRISERKSRDFQRRDDLARVYEALHSFHSEFGFFPPDEDGKIKACKGDGFETEMSALVSPSSSEKIAVYVKNLKTCEWGKDSFTNLFDPNYLPYIKTLPSDISSDKGYSYHYISNGRVFQLYAHLEGGGAEIGFDKEILHRNISCGRALCNFGRSAFGKIPLYMSLEEYEQQLRENPDLDKVLEERRVN